MTTFTDACTQYLARWERMATVRGFDRFRPESLDDVSSFFPRAFVPELRHPALAHLPAPVVDRLRLQHGLQFMHEVTLFETGIVCDIANRLVRRGGLPDFELPAAARKVLTTISTDEAYHVFVAEELIDDVERLTGKSLAAKQEISVAEQALSALRQEFRGDDLDVIETVILCLVENSITREFLEMAKSSVDAETFRTIVSAHLRDEGRHSTFFRWLLAELWAVLTEARREAVATALPRFLEASLTDATRDLPRTMQMMRAAGVAEPAIESYAESRRKTIVRPQDLVGHLGMLDNILEALRKTGVLSSCPVQTALSSAGWLAPEAAALRPAA